MNWFPLAIVALFTLIGAGLLIATLENWSRLAPVFNRWSWLFESAAALWFGYSAVEALNAGDILWGSIEAVLAGTLAWSAITSIRRLRRSESAGPKRT